MFRIENITCKVSWRQSDVIVTLKPFIECHMTCMWNRCVCFCPYLWRQWDYFWKLRCLTSRRICDNSDIFAKLISWRIWDSRDDLSSLCVHVVEFVWVWIARFYPNLTHEARLVWCFDATKFFFGWVKMLITTHRCFLVAQSFLPGPD